MAGDIVEEEVELHLVDTRKLVEEAKKLKQAERIKKKLDNVLKKSPSQLREEKEMIKRLNEQSLAKGVSPFGADPTSRGPVLPKGHDKAQTRKGAITGAKTANAFTDLQKKIKKMEKAQKKALAKLDDFQDKVVSKLDTAKSFLAAGSVSGGALGVFSGIASRFGPIGMVVAAVVATIVPQYFEQFERGGIFSTKLPITEREKNIADIDFVVDVRSGTKFITSDLRIVQGAPETSNTLNLRYEHVRYVSQELGK